MEQRSHAASERHDHLRDAPTASLQVVRGPVSQSPPVSVESRRAGSMVAPAGLAELTTTAVVARRSTRRRAACPRLPLEHLPQGDPGANGQQAAGQHQYCEDEHFDLPGRPKGSSSVLCDTPHRMDEGCPCRSAALSRIENPFRGFRMFEQSSTLIDLLARAHRVKRTA